MLSLWLPATIRTEDEAPFSSDAFDDFVPDLEEPALDEPVLPEALEAVVFTASPATAPEANSKLQLSVSPVSLFVSAKAVVPEKSGSRVLNRRRAISVSSRITSLSSAS